MPRSRRSSVIEAHNVFEKYHRHDLELQSLFEKDNDDEDSAESGKKTLNLSSSMTQTLTRKTTPDSNFPMFHRGMSFSYFFILSV